MKLRIDDSGRASRRPSGSSRGILIVGAIVLLIIAAGLLSSVTSEPAKQAPVASPAQKSSTQEPEPVAPLPPPEPISVPETSTIKPGFKDVRWGSSPASDMRYVGRGGGLTRIYERQANCLHLGDETICGIRYLFYKKKLYGVEFEESFVTRGAYRPTLLRDLEAEWGPSTGIPGGREWRSRDKKYGLTIARWTPSKSSGLRWEKVTILSDSLNQQRLENEADPDSPEMRALAKEIEEFQEEQRRRRERQGL